MKRKITSFVFVLALTSFLLTTLSFASNQREKYTINTAWKFKKGEVSLSNPQQFDNADWKIVNVPHTWNDEDALDEKDGYYRGTAWYTKTIQIPNRMQDQKVFLFFEGANQDATVYLNGQKIGEHKGGYTAFCFDITEYLNFNENGAEQNEIAVRLTNKHDKNIPPLSADFTFFGGIYRDVYIVATNKIHFQFEEFATNEVYINTPEVSQESASVKVKGNILNEQASDKTLSVQNIILDADKNVVAKRTSEIEASADSPVSFDQEFNSIKDPHLWSPEDPYLYTVKTRIKDPSTGKIVDQDINPLGFRSYKFTGKNGFYLNGEHKKLIGANRHQDYKNMGNALPDYLHIQDMKMLKEMGGNFLRIAHYPQDPSVVEMADELGFVTSIEIPLVNSITETEAFYNNTRNMLREMIHQNYNHPSVMIWCLANEVLLDRPFHSGEVGDLSDREQEYLSNMENLFREMDSIAHTLDDRSTMIVNHQWFPIYHEAELTTIPDIVGWNLYPGWYGSDITGLDSFLLKHHNKIPDQPLIISEYGAGADPRIRTFDTVRFDFSVDYQNYYHEYYLQRIQNLDYVTGGLIWNLVDFHSEGRVDAVPHINNKGITTLSRKPKDVYYYYKAHLRDTPFVKIAPALWNKRSGMQEESDKSYCEQPVWIYTNQSEVELFRNGKSLGTEEVNDRQAHFEVPFKDGTNQLEARTGDENDVIKDVMDVDFILQSLDLKAEDNQSFKTIRVNAGTHFYFTDNYGQLWLPDKSYEKGNWGYVGGHPFMTWSGERVGTDKNIFGTKNDPLYQTQRDSLEAYKFDVPKGTYEVTLYFAELLSKKERQKLIYNVGDNEEDESDKPTKRVFNVDINGHTVISRLNLATEYSEQRAVSRKFDVEVADDNGITVSFEGIKGDPVINGIKVRQVY